VILITGKGNETRQKYGNKYVPVLSDVELTKKYLAELEDMA
jgi:UDP-N-acetylmuramoyl-L-alanyl-D-glutamate--2,6-diaminopimelate ligase